MFQLPLGLQVGSGKSSLLNLVLGETRLINGSIYLRGSTAYVPQVNYPYHLCGFSQKENFSFVYPSGSLDNVWNYSREYFAWKGLRSEQVIRL